MIEQATGTELGSAVLKWTDLNLVPLLVIDNSGAVQHASSAVYSVLGVEESVEGCHVDELLRIRLPAGQSPGEIIDASCEILSVTPPPVLSCRVLHSNSMTVVSFPEDCLIKRRLGRLGECQAAEEVISQISHEIRNSLAGVSTSLEMIAGQQEPQGRDRCLRLRTEIERVTTLLRNVNDLFRPPHRGGQHCNFGAVLRNCLSLFEPLSNAHGITVDLDLTEVNTPVPIDKTRLISVIQNVILNALQTMEDGGLLRLKCQREEDGSFVAQIEDTGHGIDEDRMENVFKPFWSGRPGGTGLGLPVAQRFMQECGGELSLHSEVGVGTRVILVFPGIAEPEAVPES